MWRSVIILAKERLYDVAIIGSGPACYTAALYASRANLDTLVFQGFESGGQLMFTLMLRTTPATRTASRGRR